MKKWLGFLVVAFLFLIGGTAEASSLNVFEVTVDQPASQINQDLTYLSLQLPPASNETVMITVKNISEQPLKVKPSFNRAVTNSSGVIEYSGRRKETIDDIGIDIKELVNFDESEIQLEPQEEKILTAEITMPDNDFDGVLAGGFYFEEIPEETGEGGIRNIYSRETALLIRNHQEEITPELKIISAQPAKENGRNIIELTIDNPQNTYVHAVKIQHEIKNGSDVFLQGEKTAMSIAPNSQFKYIVPLDGKEFTNGEYTVHVTATSNENSWQGSPTFTINRQEASHLNEEDVMVESPSIPWWVWLIAGIFIVQLIIIIVLLIRKKRVR